MYIVRIHIMRINIRSKGKGETDSWRFGGRNKFLWTREPLGLPIYPQTGDGDNG